MSGTEALEEQIAHLARAVDDLSDVLHRQAGQIERLERQIARLTERESERESGAGAPPADQRPPHW